MTASVSAMLDGAGDGPALVRGSERIGYGELRERVERMAGGLAARGLGPGDPIALLLGNVPAFVVGFFAIARLGGVAVPLNPQLKPAELEFCFRESGVRAALSDAAGAESCRRLGTAVPVLDETVADAASAPEPDRSADDDAVFHYSSGSTGRPKRVPRTHRHLWAEADALVATLGLTADDTLLCTIPLFHTYGMGCCLLAAMRAGAPLVLGAEPHPLVLARERVVAEIEGERATVLPTVPFALRLLAEAPGAGGLESLRLCFSAANALPRSTFDAFDRRFGVPIRQLYGCTEAGTVTVNLDDDPHATVASAGRPLPGVELAVLGPDGEALEDGRIGEITIRSAAMTAGYAGGATARDRDAFRDGAFLSGDRGRLDEAGRLVLTGRRKLLIDVRGDKVDPIEVEDVLAVHPKVREVVVVGVAGPVEGEQLVKAVVVAEGACGERELVRYCRERLADYKVPDQVAFLEEIPRSAAGKVLRKYLIE